MRLRSPAKINLFLKVLGVRKDGYHEIRTLFERVSLFDTIELRRARSGIRLETSSKEIPSGSRNLAWRAAALLKHRFRVPSGVVIKIQKRIPVSAGLGGGSSNAATVLLGLNRLWKLNLSKKRLVKLAAGLGSDVAFFLLETPLAFGRGRGEILSVCRAPGFKIWHCLVKPGFGLSTRAVYRNFSGKNSAKPSSLTPKKADVKMLVHSIQKGDSGALSKLLVNSLEVSINKRVKEILNIKSELAGQGALGCLLSGSGSAVFGIYSSEAKARNAARFLRKKNGNWQVFAVSTV